MSDAYEINKAPSALRRRNLYPYSIHYDPATLKYVATVNHYIKDNAVTENPSDTCNRCFFKYSFLDKKDAQAFCKYYSPPVMDHKMDKSSCFICLDVFSKRNKVTLL